jgi:hypothetical protein
MSSRFPVPAFLLTFVIMLAVPALAQDGVQAIGACTIIDKPGSYVLARDIKATVRDLKWAAPGRFTGACIVIVADFVSLDLQGHTITGPQAFENSNNAGIYTTADVSDKQPTAAHIRNGCVTGFMAGIAVEGTGHMVERMRVAGNIAGMTLRGNGTKVKEVMAVSNQDQGILWFGNYGVSVEDCQVNSNGWMGIQQWNPDEYGEALGSRIVGNTVSHNGGYGIYVRCPALILQNMAHSNGSGPRDNIVVVTDPFNTPCTRSDNSPEP